MTNKTVICALSASSLSRQQSKLLHVYAHLLIDEETEKENDDQYSSTNWIVGIWDDSFVSLIPTDSPRKCFNESLLFWGNGGSIDYIANKEIENSQHSKQKRKDNLNHLSMCFLFLFFISVYSTRACISTVSCIT